MGSWPQRCGSPHYTIILYYTILYYTILYYTIITVLSYNITTLSILSLSPLIPLPPSLRPHPPPNLRPHPPSPPTPFSLLWREYRQAPSSHWERKSTAVREQPPARVAQAVPEHPSPRSPRKPAPPRTTSPPQHHSRHGKLSWEMHQRVSGLIIVSTLMENSLL